MKWIDKCIVSLLNSSQKVEIIIVDNGSTDETVIHISKHYPGIQLIITGKNIGFGQGNNFGLKIAIEQNADYVFLLNQDAWVKPETISKLIQAHVSNPEYGIISPVHLNGIGNDFDDHFYYYLIKSNVKRLLKTNILTQVNGPSLIDTPFVNAAAWLISMSCLKKTGGFDPIFFHYGEDDNYAQRVIYKGFRIGIVTDSFIYHDKDRPNPLNTLPIQKTITKDWIQFLTHACNVNDHHITRFLFKRGIRHAFQIPGALFKLKRNDIIYHYKMATKILFAYPKVKQSVLTAKDENKIPFL